jgi:hypothetical protein
VAVISHIRAVMKYPPDLVPDIAPATLYRYYAAIREHLEVQHEGKHLRHVAARAMHQAAQVMDRPPDLISAAVEVLLKEQCELPAFSTLDRFVREILGHQIQSPVAESQAIQNHRDGRCSHTHLLPIARILGIQPCRKTNLLTYARYNAQVVEPFIEVAFRCCHQGSSTDARRKGE